MAAVELVDSSSKQVLILCQRKTGKCAESELRVENITVLKINEFVSNLFSGETVNIEYLTDGIPGANGIRDCDADHCIALDGDDGERFVASHSEHYDVVILNTCPLVAMNFVMIHKILKNDGLMILKGYNCSGGNNISPDMFNQRMLNIGSRTEGGIRLGEAINKYFTVENEHFIFKKKLIGGRRRKSRKRKSRRRKRSNARVHPV
jgi:hypothetical protein